MKISRASCHEPIISVSADRLRCIPSRFSPFFSDFQNNKMPGLSRFCVRPPYLLFFSFFTHRRDLCDGVRDERNIFLGFIFRFRTFSMENFLVYIVDNCATSLDELTHLDGSRVGEKTATAWLAKAKNFFPLCTHKSVGKVTRIDSKHCGPHVLRYY